MSQESEVWVTYRADTCSKKWDPTSLVCGTPIRGAPSSSPISLRWHRSIHNRHVHTCLFPNISILQNSANSTTTTRPNPCILTELAPINSLYCSANLILHKNTIFMRTMTQKDRTLIVHVGVHDVIDHWIMDPLKMTSQTTAHLI